MQIGSLVGTAVSALAFKALNSSDTLNSLANRITGGSINRDTLAQKVLRDTVGLGLAYATDTKLLGDRSATLLPLASKILFDNTSEEMHASIISLTNELAAQALPEAGPGLMGAMKTMGMEAAKAGVASLANSAADTFIGPQFTEKLLATMIDGGKNWQPLQAYMEKMLDGYPMGRFVGGLIKDVLERTIVDKAALNQSDQPLFRALADGANEFLVGNDFKKPLQDYAQKEIVQPLMDSFTDSVDTVVPDLVGAVAQGAGQVVLDLAGTIVDTTEVLINGYTDVKENLAKQEYTQAAIGTAKTVVNAAVTATYDMATTVVPTLAQTAVTLTGITARATVGTVIIMAPTIKEGAISLYQGSLAGADLLYHAAAGAPAYQPGSAAYAKDLQKAAESPDESLAALPMPDARTSDSQWANALIKQQTLAQFAMPDLVLTTSERSTPVKQALQQGQIDAARKDTLTDLTQQLSTDQLSPFGLFGTSLQVAHNMSGNLARVASESQAHLPVTHTTSQAMAGVIDATPLKESSKAGYKVADTYAQHVGKLALDFPEGVYSYTDASKDNLNATGNLWWGENVTLADRAELRKLYNTCGGNEQLTLQVSRFLDPGMASQALAAPLLDELDPKSTGLLQLPTGLQLKLADTTAQYQYQLRPKGANVELTISAAWDVKEYGADAQQRRSPQGTQPSQLTSSITVTIAPDGTFVQSAPSLQCSIRNEFKFDAYGARENPSATDVSVGSMFMATAP